MDKQTQREIDIGRNMARNLKGHTASSDLSRGLLRELNETLPEAFPNQTGHDKAAAAIVRDMENPADHTPGPWKEHEGFIVGPDDETIADPRCLPPTADNTATMDANARLIAAAPELLEACKMLLPYVADQVHRGAVPGQDTSHYGDERAVTAGRAAIAKATRP